MITRNRHYSLPNKNHDVVDDINDLHSTFAMIDDDVKNTEEEIEELSETVSDLENRSVHLPYAVENSEIQNISANRYLVVNQNGDGFECLDGGGDAGGFSGQCSIKKTDANFNTAWGNILEISKNGMTPQENSETSQANETHIFKDETEIENDKQLPKVELTNCQAESDLESSNNASVIFCDNAEEIEEELPIATRENFGLVKIGSGFTNDTGTISAPIITKATENNFGIIKTGDGLVNNAGTISRDELNPATFSNFGIVKLGENLSINQNGEMEIADMADAPIIYKLSQMKLVENGNINLEEKSLIYRAFVTSDLMFSINVNFEPRDDFTFILELISDGTHLVAFSDRFDTGMNQLPINRGTTKLKITKKLGLPYYNVIVYQQEAAAPTLLTPSIDGCISSEFTITSPNGGSWFPGDLLKTTYSNYCDITELNFKFETLVCVDYVNYLSRSNSVPMGEFILKGSNDGKIWTTLLYKNNEIIYGKVYTEIKGCFRYFNLKIGYNSDDNKPGAVTLWGTQIDNNESEIVPLTPYMASNETAFAKMTASNSGSSTAASLTDFDCNTLFKLTKTADDWIKYELNEPKIANILELNYRGMGEFYGFYGDRQPNWFKLEGSNDDENWTLLLERQYIGNTLALDNNVLFYQFNNQTAYKYYKLTCLATNSSSDEWGIGGFKLYQRKQGKTHFYNAIPKLTSANQDGYEVSSSSQWDSSYATVYAFDGDSATQWASSTPYDSWLQVKFPEPTICNAVRLSNRYDPVYVSQSPINFEIQASNDMENWTTLLSKTNVSWTQGETKLLTFENDTAYSYYRFYSTKVGNGGVAVAISAFEVGQSSYEYKRLLDKYDYLIPAMSSASQNGYVVSASAEFNSDHKAIHAFDKNDSTKWAATATNPQWLQIQLPTAKICNLVSIKARNDQWWNQAPTAFEILGSNNGTNWTTLLSESNVIWEFQGQTKTFELPEATYSYYRLQMTSSQAGDYFGLARFDLIHNYKIQEY